MSHRQRCVFICLLLALGSPVLADSGAADQPLSGWQPLFNGKDLDGWIAKIRGYPLGENFAQTFRVENGVLTVSYEGYERFDDRFGHLFYQAPHSHYRVRLEYRFLGEPAPGAPDWAWRNSGIMLHSQDPVTMQAEQDFPISIEAQFLGGRSDGSERPTGNLCTPGTHVVYAGEFTETHCLDSTSPTFNGDQWVRFEALVQGGDRIVHFVNGEAVIEYGQMTTGGGVVSGHEPAMKPEGKPLESGYLSLQSEGHPVQFRNIEISVLEDPSDASR